MNRRFRNYGLWVSIFAFIPLILNSLGINILPASYDKLLSCLLSILVIAGILSNPNTENKWYLDDDILYYEDNDEEL